MERGVKLLNNRKLYHLDDSKSITFFSRVLPCFVERRKKNLVESFCVWFLSARDYSRWKTPMNFVFTSLSFLASNLVFVFLLYFFFLTRYKNKLFGVEWKWQTFFWCFSPSSCPSEACHVEVFWQQILCLTRPGENKKFVSERKKKLFVENK